MMVRIKLFARARDLAQADELQLDMPAGSTVADLRRVLAGRRPELAGLLPRCAFAVDAEFASDDIVLEAENEAALLPPVSGG
jgi:molybdopterin converting factor subunit 1